MFFRRFFAWALVAVASVRAQEPLNAPVPLLPAESPSLSPGQITERLHAARNAQDVGQNLIAIAAYEQLLKDPGVDHSAVILALATVLLDDGRPAEAEQVLLGETGTRSAAWHLRAALAAGQQKKVGQMRAEFDATKPGELAPSDVSWHHFLQGMLTDMETPGGNKPKADVWYQRAAEAATTDLARVRFELAYEEERLRTIPASDEAIERTRQSMERFRNRGTGYDAARQLAVMYDAAGFKTRAVELLQEQLLSLSRQERERLDDFRLLLGLIGGAGDGAGRNALNQLLEQGSVAMKQRSALQLLARASQTGPARAQFRGLLDKLIGQTPRHQILDNLYLVRAQVALATKTADGYAQADSDAAKLRQEFPKSPLVAYSYWVSAQSAWEQLRFLSAADSAAKARDALPPGGARGELGVFVAEAWFRAGVLARADGAGSAGGTQNFRNAAEAYAAALRDPPAGMLPKLLFQRVLSEIEAGSLEEAKNLLDSFARDPAFDLRTRWQAEWNLARALRIAGKTDQAFARVSGLLATGGDASVPPLPAELRAQMAWLQAHLSFDLTPSDETLAFIDKLDRSLEGVEPRMRIEIASAGLLLKAQTNFALKQASAGLEALDVLRKTYPRTPAAIQSYMVQADYLAEDNSVEAQRWLTKLAEDFPDSELAPQALFAAALHAESRGHEENYVEAVRRIEDAIALQEKYPPKDRANSLVFTARMKQGELFRQLNQAPQAQDLYQNLIHNYPQHGQIVYAQLALADCLNAQSANDPSRVKNAEMLFEQLTARLDAPVDVRIEAGYKLGELFARSAQPAKALEIWWRDVVQTFLNDAAAAAQLGTTGRYWMARTLWRSGELLDQQQRPDEAKEMWTRILTSKLGNDAAVRQKLMQPAAAEVRP